mmetsp:Transcript_74511/g.155333  ORF Transcript_74511/g.155333 Transcript_74511/m.155333 type:complete len:220 (-) Transcript_74511:501-1160(-)
MSSATITRKEGEIALSLGRWPCSLVAPRTALKRRWPGSRPPTTSRGTQCRGQTQCAIPHNKPLMLPILTTLQCTPRVVCTTPALPASQRLGEVWAISLLTHMRTPTSTRSPLQGPMGPHNQEFPSNLPFPPSTAACLPLLSPCPTTDSHSPSNIQANPRATRPQPPTRRPTPMHSKCLQRQRKQASQIQPSLLSAWAPSLRLSTPTRPAITMDRVSNPM